MPSGTAAENDTNKFHSRRIQHNTSMCPRLGSSLMLPAVMSNLMRCQDWAKASVIFEPCSGKVGQQEQHNSHAMQTQERCCRPRQWLLYKHDTLPLQHSCGPYRHFKGQAPHATTGLYWGPCEAALAARYTTCAVGKHMFKTLSGGLQDSLRKTGTEQYLWVWSPQQTPFHKNGACISRRCDTL